MLPTHSLCVKLKKCFINPGNLLWCNLAKNESIFFLVRKMDKPGRKNGAICAKKAGSSILVYHQDQMENGSPFQELLLPESDRGSSVIGSEQNWVCNVDRWWVFLEKFFSVVAKLSALCGWEQVWQERSEPASFFY